MTSSPRTKPTQRLTQKPKRLKAMTPNAFTLVELLVVVAIVGILSSVALPNFLSQTDKAKATEAKTNLASTLKQAHAKFLEDGEDPKKDAMTDNYGTPADDKTNFNYAQSSFTSNIWTKCTHFLHNLYIRRLSGLSPRFLRGLYRIQRGKPTRNLRKRPLRPLPWGGTPY